MKLLEVKENKKAFLDLLLLADEEEAMVDRYLEKGTMYLLAEDGVKGECVVLDVGDGTLEIKNIAVAPAFHRKGYGKAMIDLLEQKYRGQYTRLQVGTGDSPATLGFYKACGFTRSHTVPNFFTDNYRHPIYDGGVLLRDMIYLQKPLSSKAPGLWELAPEATEGFTAGTSPKAQTNVETCDPRNPPGLASPNHPPLTRGALAGMVPHSPHILPKRDCLFVRCGVCWCQKNQEVSSMNAHITGKLIAQKRREKNLTQEQLGDLLHVSNKTVSKWETGRCMPDYTLVGRLCRELDITPAQLLTGEEQADGPGEAQLLELLRRTQALEKQRTGLFGLVLIVMGISLMTVSQNLGGSDFRDFLSGLILGLSVGEMLVGIYLTARAYLGQ